MLKVESISQIKVNKDLWDYRDEWRRARLAKFTSSMIYVLMGEKPFTQGAMTYIYEKVGEELTGQPAKKEVRTEATQWGLENETNAIRKYGEYAGVTDFLATQALITPVGTRFGSTPDAIKIIQAYDDDRYNVETAEIKCYPSYEHHIRCVLCNTPEQLKKEDPKLYYQVIDQMDNCDCMCGNAVMWHPNFRAGGFKVIPFRKIELVSEFKFLRERKLLAVKKFDEIREKLLTLQNPVPSWKQQSASLSPL